MAELLQRPPPDGPVSGAPTESHSMQTRVHDELALRHVERLEGEVVTAVEGGEASCRRRHAPATTHDADSSDEERACRQRRRRRRRRETHCSAHGGCEHACVRSKEHAASSSGRRRCAHSPLSEDEASRSRERRRRRRRRGGSSSSSGGGCDGGRRRSSERRRRRRGAARRMADSLSDSDAALVSDAPSDEPCCPRAARRLERRRTAAEEEAARTDAGAGDERATRRPRTGRRPKSARVRSQRAPEAAAAALEAAELEEEEEEEEAGEDSDGVVTADAAPEVRRRTRRTERAPVEQRLSQTSGEVVATRLLVTAQIHRQRSTASEVSEALEAPAPTPVTAAPGTRPRKKTRFSGVGDSTEEGQDEADESQRPDDGTAAPPAEEGGEEEAKDQGVERGDQKDEDGERNAVAEEGEDDAVNEDEEEPTPAEEQEETEAPEEPPGESEEKQTAEEAPVQGEEVKEESPEAAKAEMEEKEGKGEEQEAAALVRESAPAPSPASPATSPEGEQAADKQAEAEEDGEAETELKAEEADAATVHPEGEERGEGEGQSPTEEKEREGAHEEGDEKEKVEEETKDGVDGKFQAERLIFGQLLELKRLQIRAGRANEAVLAKRLADELRRAALPGARAFPGPYTLRALERHLYEQLRLLQAGDRRMVPRLRTHDDLEKLQQALRRARLNNTLHDVPDNPVLCTHGTHRCHHAAHAYTGVPCAAYITKGPHAHAGRRVGTGVPRSDGSGFLPRIDPSAVRSLRYVDPTRPVTLELSHGKDKQVIALPTDKLDRNKRYYVTFTIKGGNSVGSGKEGRGGATKGGGTTESSAKSLRHHHAESL